MSVDPDPSAAPSFFLYGEPPRAAEAGFLHVEALDVRSRPSGWSIRPHRHDDLCHVFLMVDGGGEILAPEGAIAFAAPCLLFIPAGVTHGFAYHGESTGQVLTVARRYLELRPGCREALEVLFDRLCVVDGASAGGRLHARFTALARELGWAAPGHDAAVEAQLLDIFVTALRLRQQEAADRGGIGRDEALVARFREAVEAGFRSHRPLSDYAGRLGVSATHLHRACRRAAGQTPLGVIRERLALEAKRGLLYSDMRIAELAFDLGFADAAYFSRFFAKAAGVSARDFRRSRRSEAV